MLLNFRAITKLSVADCCFQGRTRVGLSPGTWKHSSWYTTTRCKVSFVKPLYRVYSGQHNRLAAKTHSRNLESKENRRYTVPLRPGMQGLTLFPRSINGPDFGHE